MSEKLVELDCSFDSAVSRLSIGGYYLEGFIEDSNNSQKGYRVFDRTTRNPIAWIYREGLFEFLSQDKIYEKKRKEILNYLEGKFKVPKAIKRVSIEGLVKNK
jgi:hypothetical protein